MRSGVSERAVANNGSTCGRQKIKKQMCDVIRLFHSSSCCGSCRKRTGRSATEKATISAKDRSTAV
jgi:hypothetical protein